MSSPDTLLVATDFSLPATKAVEQAAYLAADLGHRLCILHVVDTLDLEASDWPAEGEIESKMEALVAKLPGGVLIETVMREASVVKTILREADDERVAALVVGYSGKSGFIQRIGSTASKVARRSRKPVFVLTSSFSQKVAVVGCLDFSETSHTVIDWTRRLTAAGSHLRQFVHIAVPLKRLVDYNLGSGGEDSPIPTFGGSEARYRERIVTALKRLDGLDETDEVEVCFDDSIRKGLEDVSADYHPALLVIGRTEHSALHDRFLGSTAEQILNYSECSTLVVGGIGAAFPS